MHIALLHFLLVPALAIAALNATSIPRIFLFALLAHQAWLTTQTIEAARLGTAAGFPSLDTHIADIAIKIAILVTLHMGVVLFLEGIVLPKRDTWAGQVKEGYKMVFNGRRIGTSRLAPQVPILESEAITLVTRKDDEVSLQRQQQSRGGSFHDRVGTVRREPRLRFVLRRLSLALLLALLEFAIKPPLLRLYLPTTYDDFAPAKEVFFRRLLLPGRGPPPDAHEVAVRLWMTFETTWAAYSFYTIWHSLASAAAVTAGLDRPHEWPPLFGDIRQAYSLRRYWVKFFDRLIYRTMSGYAKFAGRWVGLCDAVGKAKTAWSRWVLNGVVFMLSGVFHAWAAKWQGYRCGFWEEIWWWAANFVAVLGETVVLDGLRKIFPRWYHQMAEGRAAKIVGRFWVCLFIFWASPKYLYPVMICGV
ncbi:hypothetical protein BN1723_009745, partial [Verticillium longisporum]